MSQINIGIIINLICQGINIESKKIRITKIPEENSNSHTKESHNFSIEISNDIELSQENIQDLCKLKEKISNEYKIYITITQKNNSSLVI